MGSFETIRAMAGRGRRKGLDLRFQDGLGLCTFSLVQLPWSIIIVLHPDMTSSKMHEFKHFNVKCMPLSRGRYNICVEIELFDIKIFSSFHIMKITIDITYFFVLQRGRTFWSFIVLSEGPWRPYFSNEIWVVQRKNKSYERKKWRWTWYTDVP